MKLWFKNSIIDKEKALINVLSPTSQYGINVFEGIRCYWNEGKKQLYAFKLDNHIKRLLNSATLLRLKHNCSFDKIKTAFIETIRANRFEEDTIVRITLFLDGYGNWASKEPVEMFISAIPKGRYFDIDTGIKCCVSSWQRINDNSVPPRIKAGANYINSRMAQLEAVENGYDSCILLNKQGKVAEAPGACIFIIKNNKLITPSTTSSILESINREFIIEISKKELNLNVEEREIDRTELYLAEEAFLAGTAVEITPIYKIDGFLIKKREITLQIQNLFFSIVRGKYKFNEYKKYLTEIYI